MKCLQRAGSEGGFFTWLLLPTSRKSHKGGKITSPILFPLLDEILAMGLFTEKEILKRRGGGNGREGNDVESHVRSPLGKKPRL